MRDKDIKMRAMGMVAFIIVAALSLLTAQTAFAQDLVILSHRFDESSFSSEVIGEIYNNNTRSYDKFDVNIIANFRDPAGILLTSENGFIDAETLGVGDSSAFNIFLLDRELPETASTYDLIVNDDRIVVGAPLEGGSSDNDDDDNGDGDNNDDGGDGNGNNNGNDNGNNNSTGPIECPPGSELRDGECEAFYCPDVISYGDGPCDEYPAEMEPDPPPCPLGMTRSGERSCMSIDEEGSTEQPQETLEEPEPVDDNQPIEEELEPPDEEGDESDDNDEQEQEEESDGETDEL